MLPLPPPATNMPTLSPVLNCPSTPTWMGTLNICLGINSLSLLHSALPVRYEASLQHDRQDDIPRCQTIRGEHVTQHNVTRHTTGWHISNQIMSNHTPMADDAEAQRQLELPNLQQHPMRLYTHANNHITTRIFHTYHLTHPQYNHCDDSQHLR
jgi:hypothetical protein